MNNQPSQDYTCSFCLSETSTENKADGTLNYPRSCPACGVVECGKCGTWLKGTRFRFCYGCGEINPPMSARFCRSDSTAVIYAQKDWMQRNKSKHRDGSSAIAYGADGRVTLREDDGHGRSWEVRELTEDERRALKEDNL